MLWVLNHNSFKRLISHVIQCLANCAASIVETRFCDQKWDSKCDILINLWPAKSIEPKVGQCKKKSPHMLLPHIFMWLMLSIICLLTAEEACKKQLESGTCNLHEDNLYCNQCYRKIAAATMSQPKTPTQEYVNMEDPDCCPRCGKRVYFAEQIQCLNRKWHVQCLNCGGYMS